MQCANHLIWCGWRDVYRFLILSLFYVQILWLDVVYKCRPSMALKPSTVNQQLKLPILIFIRMVFFFSDIHFYILLGHSGKSVYMVLQVITQCGEKDEAYFGRFVSRYVAFNYTDTYLFLLRGWMIICGIPHLKLQCMRLPLCGPVLSKNFKMCYALVGIPLFSSYPPFLWFAQFH